MDKDGLYLILGLGVLIVLVFLIWRLTNITHYVEFERDENGRIKAFIERYIA